MDSGKFGLVTATPPVVDRSTEVKVYASPQDSSVKATEIKAFINSKSPQSDNQFAATVAYYYQFEAPTAQQKTTITSADLQDATRLAGGNRLGDPSQTLRNALNQGYFDQAGRGSYALSTVGENLVAMALPQAEGKVRVVKQKRVASKKTKKNSGSLYELR